MSTNSRELKEDILKGTSTKDLEKLVIPRLKSGETKTTVLQYVTKAMEDSGYEDVIYNQPDGSVNKDEFILDLQNTLYLATLSRINRTEMNSKEAAKSAVQSFMSDYKIDPTKTYMIPVDVGGQLVNQGFVTIVNDNILLGIQDTSEGNYLDRFHGADGYMHYAKFANVEGLTEEMVKEKITSTIRNNAKWLMSADGTGAVLYAEFADGTRPITNAKGQKIETSFLNPSSTYPITGDELPLIEYVDPYGEINLGEENMSVPNGVVPQSVSAVIGNVFVSEAKADMPTLQENFFTDTTNIDMLAKHEGNKLKPYNLEYTVNGKKVIEDFRTVGRGHRITKAEEKSGKIYNKYDINNLTQEQVDDIFKQDVKKAVSLVNDLGKQSTINLNTINQSAYNILVQMAFQMGSNPKTKKGLAGFEKTLEFIKEGEYGKAAKEMLNSTWHDQTPSRAKELSELMANI